MNTNRLEVTGNVGLDKKGMRTSSAQDLHELSYEDLKGVAGGVTAFPAWWPTLWQTQYYYDLQHFNMTPQQALLAVPRKFLAGGIG